MSEYKAKFSGCGVEPTVIRQEEADGEGSGSSGRVSGHRLEALFGALQGMPAQSRTGKGSIDRAGQG